MKDQQNMIVKNNSGLSGHYSMSSAGPSSLSAALQSQQLL